MLVSIGFRGTNGICSLKAHDSTNEQETERYLYVVDKLGTDFQHYDIKSSIYCVTTALNTGIWDPKDYYQEMYGRKFEYRELRDSAKLSYMSFYFIRSARNCSFHLRSIIDDSMHKSTDSEVALVSAIQDKMRTALHGRLYESEIFLHETAFYLHVSLELTRRGWKVIQVYDGFYASHKDKTRSLKQEIDSILEEFVPRYVDKYVATTANKLKYIKQQEKRATEYMLQQEANSFLHAQERMFIYFDSRHNRFLRQQVNQAQDIASIYKQIEVTQSRLERNNIILNDIIKESRKDYIKHTIESQKASIVNQSRCLKTSKINISNIRNLDDFRRTIKHSIATELYQELFGDTERWFRQCLFEQEQGIARHFSEDFFKLTAKLRKNTC